MRPVPKRCETNRIMTYFAPGPSLPPEPADLSAPEVRLNKVADLLRSYCRALTGRPILLLPAAEPGDEDPGAQSLPPAAAEGNAIFLPAVISHYSRQEDNLRWVKTAATHHAAHLEFGSFDFDFDRPARLFTDLRQEREPGIPILGNHRTEFQRFFALFADRELAFEAFTAMEDARLDSRVRHEYRGLLSTYERAQRDSLQDRPDVLTLPLREAILEDLVCLSLGQTKGLPVPRAAREHMLEAAGVLALVMTTEATVEDSAEAAIRLYDILESVPNVVVPGDEWENIALDSVGAPLAEGGWVQPWMPPRPVRAGELGGGQEVAFTPLPAVDFRGQFNPELAPFLRQVAQSKSSASSQSAVEDQEQGQGLRFQSLDAERAKAKPNLSPVATSGRRQKPPDPQDNVGAEDGGGKSLDDDGPTTSLYDEWDFRSRGYKLRWCRVRQQVMEEGTTDFFDKTLHEHRRLASQVQKQFQMIEAELLRKIKGLPDGEEFELDAVIEAVVDRRAGQTPSEKLYWRRHKLERDVAVALLLDMSASTALGVDDTETYNGPRGLRNLRDLQSGARKSRNKRIVDVEKESTVLFIKALETSRDAYGIYGFSGYGRGNVEFFVIKNLNEPFSDTIKRRLDKVQPLGTTRMGPAIRHAVSKLDRQDARTRILFLLSDGQPGDNDYIDSQYAINDTRMALTEARQKGIIPFCLTVDKAGHDYLGTMCADMGYEVVDDISSLPERLPALYRTLTT